MLISTLVSFESFFHCLITSVSVSSFSRHRVFVFCIASSSQFLSHLFPLCVRVTEVEVHANGYIGQCSSGENLLPEHARVRLCAAGTPLRSVIRTPTSRAPRQHRNVLPRQRSWGRGGRRRNGTNICSRTFLYPGTQTLLYSCSNKTKL